MPPDSIDIQTHVPRPDEDGDVLDFRVEAVHVLQLLNELAEILTLSHVLKYVRLLLAAGDLYVQTTVVHGPFDQLLDCSNIKVHPRFLSACCHAPQDLK